MRREYESYEASPIRDSGDGGVEVCEPGEATNWAVYGRLPALDNGCRRACWICDCGSKENAEAVAAALEKHPHMVEDPPLLTIDLGAKGASYTREDLLRYSEALVY